MVFQTETQPDPITVFPTIGNWPLSQFKEFKEFATINAGGTYWVAIMLLMERSKRLDTYESKQFFSDSSDEEIEPKEKPLTLGD